MDYVILCSTIAVAGVTSHLFLFINGEWGLHAPIIAAVYTGLHVFLLIAFAWMLPVFEATGLLIAVSTSYFSGLFGSIAIYRLFFHRLKSFPGSFGHRVTAFWSTKNSVFSQNNFKWHVKVQELHVEYGDFVRIRPREISINHPDAIKDIHGMATKCSKGPWYDMTYPWRSLQMIRDHAYHGERRKVWNKAFTTKALNGYEPRILNHCVDLLAQLSNLGGKPGDATRWFTYFGFDVISDLTFNESFNILKTGEQPLIIQLMAHVKPMVGALTCTPWLFSLLHGTPWVGAQRADFLDKTRQRVQKRKENVPEQSDLFTYLLDDDSKKSKDPKFKADDLVFDADLAITAGGDTTAGALAATTFLLASHPEKFERLQAEIDPLFNSANDFSHLSVIGKPMLEGCINEALRLFPPVPSGVQRMTPPEGANIAGRWIPGDTLVSTPTFTIHRDPRNFSRPNDFIPERWSSQPDLMPRKDAFVPFSTGTFGCAGKPLAMMELRMAISLIVRKFDIKTIGTAKNVGQGKNYATMIFERDPGMKDYFVAQMAPLNVVFEERK